MTDDDDILAGEYALGLMTPDEASAAEARFATDAELSSRVQWWREHLTSFADEAATAPSPEVWRRIEARLATNDNGDLLQSVRRWRWATGAATAAAAILGIVALRSPTVIAVPKEPPTSAASPLVASLSGKQGAAVTIAYSSAGRQMLLTPVTLDPGKGDAELWIIPVGQTVPISMGLIDATHPAARALDPRHAAMVAAGATFAISQEAKGGSPTGKATGPIVASGKIIRV